MNISILNDTSRTSNWGCAGTMAGLTSTLQSISGGQPISSIELGPLPFKKIKLLRSLATRRLARCLMQSTADPVQLGAALSALNFTPPAGPLCERLYLNGEGDIHTRSGHLIRLLGIATYWHSRGSEVYAVNQSVDLKPGSRAAEVTARVYRNLDFVSVREPCSLRLLHGLGVERALLIPDAAFSLAPPSKEQIEDQCRRLALPAQYIALTGSSILNARRPGTCIRLFQQLRQRTGLPVVMLASTKTDRALGQVLQKLDNDLILITDSHDYRTAIEVIGGAQLLVGGRFHPAIFAARQGVPLVALSGNTHKLAGLMEMLEYPEPAFDWRDTTTCIEAVERVLENRSTHARALAARAALLAHQVNRLASPDATPPRTTQV